MTYSSKARLLLVGAAFLTLAGPAFSLDGQDLMVKLNGLYGPDVGTLAAASVDINGSNVTLKGASFTPKAAGAKPVQFGDLALTGVTQAGDGSYSIDKVTFPSVDLTEDKTQVKINDIYLSGVYVPANPNGGTLESMPLYEEAHVGTISVTEDGKQVFTAEEASGSVTKFEDGKGLDFSGSVTGIAVDLSMVDDPASRDAIQKLGLEKLEGSLETSASWEIESGALDVDTYTFDVTNVGTLDVSFGINGYTMALLKQFQDTAAKMQADPNNEQVQQAAGVTMLGLMQQLSFVGAEISFSDAGITKRGLDYAGSQQNMPGEQMAQMVKAMVPLMLAELKLGELQTAISQAVNTFIDNPRNITITAEPENPVPVPMIMGAAMGAPETLPKVLGVTVSAND